MSKPLALEVEARCRSMWGESWHDLLMHFRGRNMFARQLLVADLTSVDDIDDKISRLAAWINSADRVRADLGAIQQGCVVEGNTIKCYRRDSYGC